MIPPTTRVCTTQDGEYNSNVLVACLMGGAYLCLNVSFSTRPSHYARHEALATIRLSLNATPNTPSEESAGYSGTTTVPSEKQEQRQIIFIKVHKAASSTVQNILLRFSLARDLNILLPIHPRDHINDFGSSIDPNRILPHPTGGLFDILCDHVIFNEDVLAPYFPTFTVRIAIVREPLQQMLSALAYFSHVFKRPDLVSGLEKFKQAPLEGFLRHPEHFYNPSLGVARSYINNRMSVDLGFDLKHFEASKQNMTKIRGFLDKLEQQFDLILIANYFDESMILLRRLLNWSIKDIIYLELNTANSNEEGFRKSDLNQRPSFNSSTMLAFRKWAAIDLALYDHFLAIFLNKIQKEQFFQEEVNAFREARDLVANFCIKAKRSNVSDDGSLIIEETEWIEAFTVTETECQLMSMRELDLVTLAIERQKMRILRSHKAMERKPIG